MRTENGFLIAQWIEADITSSGTPSTPIQMCPPAVIQAISALVNIGQTCTATITAHGYFNGQNVQINVTGDQGFAGYYSINVLTPNTFSYQSVTAPVAVFGTGTCATYKVRTALVYADPANSAVVQIGPNSTATARSLAAGQEYNIPQFSPVNDFGTKIDLSTWYFQSTAASQVLHILWLSIMLTLFFLTNSASAQGGYVGVQKLVGGTNVTLSPASGTGVVTVNASGGSGTITPGSGINVSGSTVSVDSTVVRTNAGIGQRIYGTPSFLGGIPTIGGTFPWADPATLYEGNIDINMDWGPTQSSIAAAYPGGTNGIISQFYHTINEYNPHRGTAFTLYRCACTNSSRGIFVGLTGDGTSNYIPQYGMAVGMLGDDFILTNNATYRFAFQSPSMQILGSDNDLPFVVSYNDTRAGDIIEGQVPLLICNPTNIGLSGVLDCGFPFQTANFWDPRQVGFPYTLMADENSGNVYATNGTSTLKSLTVLATNAGGTVIGATGAGAYGGLPINLNGSTAFSSAIGYDVVTCGYQGDNRLGWWVQFGQFTKNAHAQASPWIICESSNPDLYAGRQTGTQTNEFEIYSTHNAEFFFPLAVDGALTAASATITNNLSASNITASGSTGFTGVGSSLTALNASQVTSGTLPYSALPSGVITNNQATTWASTNAGGTNGIIFQGTTNFIDFRKGASSMASLGSNGDLRIGGTANLVGNVVVGGSVNGPSWSADSAGNFSAASYSLGTLVSMVGISAGVLRIDDFNSGSDFNQISFGSASSATGAAMFFAKNPATITFKASDGAGVENVNVTGTIVIGASTNVASFTTVFTNFIDGGTYTNATGRNIFVWTPCTFTPGTGVAGQATYAIKVGGVIKSVYSSGTLATSLAMPETNAVSYLVTNSGVFIFTNLSSGTGSSAAILPGGYYEVH